MNNYALISQFYNNNILQFYRISITNIDNDSVLDYKIFPNDIMKFLATHKNLKVIVIENELDAKNDKIISLSFDAITHLLPEQIFTIK